MAQKSRYTARFANFLLHIMIRMGYNGFESGGVASPLPLSP
uniref:Uncharacterized protein n=1 Tax=Myoviridae sp. ct9Uc11 TaxID=2825042 RepID=A0A8S5U995_9CAUD|nr:MAG TPA: hypothetical protein [Myoviridae sp. ct9Uc11]